MATMEDSGTEITTAELAAIPDEDLSSTVSDLDAEMLENLVALEEVPSFADEVAEQFAEDFCRRVMSVEEIDHRRRLAGVTALPVVSLPVSAQRFSSSSFVESLRGAA